MNKKSKKLMIATVAAACTLTVGAMGLTACSGGTDWKSYSYDDFAEITQAEWDAKEIEHQFVIGKHGTNGMGSWYSLVNLYSDGSVIHLQGFDTGERPNWNWTDADHYIRWASYGYWEVSDGTLEYTNPTGTETADEGNIVITYTRWWDESLLDSDQPMEKEAATCQTEIYKNDDGSLYIPENKLYEWFTSDSKGADPYGEELPESSPVKYNTLTEWYNSWKDNQQPIKEGPGGPPASDEDQGS